MECEIFDAMGSKPSIPVYHNLAGKAPSARLRKEFQSSRLNPTIEWKGRGVRNFDQIQRDFFISACKQRVSGPCVRECAAQSGDDGALGCQCNYFLSVWQRASNYLIPAPLYFWWKGSASLLLHALLWTRSVSRAVSHWSLTCFEKAIS